MSIVERVAELLGPIERAGSKSAAPSEPVHIERAATKSVDAAQFPEARERTAQREADDLAAALKATATLVQSTRKPSAPSIYRIDRSHLRRQGIVTPDDERTPHGESFRRIKSQILDNVTRSKPGELANLVLVTSSLPEEGKTFCAINLAISMALERDRTVLLVDADVAQPSVPKALGLKVDRGLMDVLIDRRIDLAEVLCKTDIGKLMFLPAGTAHQHSTELLASDAMRLLLQEMAERYHDRIILFDSPPLLAASEASVLASQMGQIIIVVEAGRTPEAALKAALGRIEASNVTGLLLNKGEDPGLRYHYGEYGKLAK